METNIKFACAGWGFRDLSLPDYFHAAAGLGLLAVEINVSSGTPKHLLPDCTDAEVNEVARWAEDAAVRVVSLVGDSVGSADSAVLEAQISQVHRLTDIAMGLGASVVVIYAEGARGEEMPQEAYTRLHSALNRLGDYVQRHGVHLAVENHGGPTATGLRIAKIMQGIHYPAVGVNYDAANFLKIGVDPLIALRQITPWVNYSHWKDVRWVNGDTAYCGVGEGEIRWDPIVKELLQAGYGGYWAIEYEAPEDVERGTKDSLAYLQNLFAKL